MEDEAINAGSSQCSKGDERKRHRCTFEGCNASFYRKDRWSQHMYGHNNIKMFVCNEEDCKKSYTSRSHLERHINSAHRKYHEGEVNFSCPICNKDFANRQNLKRHIKTHDSKFYCEICRLEFRKKHMLSAHMYRHTGIKPFSCQLCSKTFVTLLEKKKHMRSHKLYECTEPSCHLLFDVWSKYQKHLKEDHHEEFICDTCGRVFRYRTHIIRHIRLHNRDRQKFECPYKNCGRNYSRNSNLRQHILIIHEKIIQECPICKAQLCTKAKLNQHIVKIHLSEPKVKTPKTRATGRKPRKDIGTVKVISALKLARLDSEQPISSNSNIPHVEALEVHVA